MVIDNYRKVIVIDRLDGKRKFNNVKINDVENTINRLDPDEKEKFENLKNNLFKCLECNKNEIGNRLKNIATIDILNLSEKKVFDLAINKTKE